MTTAVKVLSGFLAGAAIGTITGILIAPDKGKNTLKKIKEESKHLTDDIGESISKTVHSLTNASRDRDKGTEEREFENGRVESRRVGV
jgi:gas vesicle protein